MEGRKGKGDGLGASCVRKIWGRVGYSWIRDRSVG
jgi:hypothetical protein